MPYYNFGLPYLPEMQRLLFLGFLGVASTYGATTDHSSTSEHSSSTTSHTSEHSTDYTVAYALSIFLIVTCIIFVTVVFEACKERMLEHTPKHMRSVIEQLFSEITILGFISLLTFALMQSDLLPELSEAVFADAHHPDLVIYHFLEQIHYLLFGTMVLLILEVIYLMRLGAKSDKHWQEYNFKVQGKSWRDEYANKLPKGAIYKCFPFLLYSHEAYHIFVFFSLRNEFIKDRSVITFEQKETQEIEDNFDYSMYLSILYGKTLSTMISLRKRVWFTVWMLSAIVLAFVILIHNTIVTAWLWGIIGWYLLVVLLVLHSRSKHILHRCVNPKDIPEELALLMFGTGNKKNSGARPSWTKKPPMDGAKFLRNKLCGISPNAFESCFWFGRNGPDFFHYLLQLQLLTQSVYAVIAIWFIIVTISEEQNDGMVFLYILFTLTPVVFSRIFLLPHAARNIVHICGIVSFRDQEAVAEVRRHQKTARAVRSLMLLENLVAVQGAGGRTPTTMSQKEQIGASASDFVEMKMQTLSEKDQHRMKEMEVIFDRFDTDESGTVDIEELGNLLAAVGTAVTAAQRGQLLRSMDKDGDGQIDKDEFLAWQLLQLEKERGLSRGDLHARAVQLLRAFKAVAQVEIERQSSAGSSTTLLQPTSSKDGAPTEEKEAANGAPLPGQRPTAAAKKKRASGAASAKGPSPHWWERSGKAHARRVLEGRSRATTEEEEEGDDGAAIELVVGDEGGGGGGEAGHGGITPPWRRPSVGSPSAAAATAAAAAATAEGEEGPAPLPLQRGAHAPEVGHGRAPTREVEEEGGAAGGGGGGRAAAERGEEGPLELTIEEFQAGLQTLDRGLGLQAGIGLGEIHDLVTEIDKNGDGVIDAEEFAALLVRYADLERPPKPGTLKPALPLPLLLPGLDAGGGGGGAARRRWGAPPSSCTAASRT